MCCQFDNTVFRFFQRKLMNGIIPQIPRQRPNLPHQIDLVGVSVLQDDLSFCVGGKLSQGLAILNADLKHHTLQGLQGYAVDLLNG